MKLTINHKQETEGINHKRETDGRIIKKYPNPLDHSAIIFNRFDLLFNRRANPYT
jgi:hypothetical protein